MNDRRIADLTWSSRKRAGPASSRLKPTSSWRKTVVSLKGKVRADSRTNASSVSSSLSDNTTASDSLSNISTTSHIHTVDALSGWMIKPVEPYSSSKCQLYCENNQIRWCWVALLHYLQDHNFFFPCQTCPFRWSHLARMKHNHLCLRTCVAVAARESVSQAATPAIRAICTALSAHMFPLAPLKVADITGGLDDISGGFTM